MQNNQDTNDVGQMEKGQSSWIAGESSKLMEPNYDEEFYEDGVIRLDQVGQNWRDGDGTVAAPMALKSAVAETDGPNAVPITRKLPAPGTRKRTFNYNLYASKKSAAQGMLDLALLMANSSQLKHVLLSDGKHRFYWAMLILLSISIVVQILVGMALILLVRYNITKELLDEAVNKQNESAKKRIVFIEFLNNVVVVAIFHLTVINVFISAFGLNDETVSPALITVNKTI
uniref:Uncharacterized protein n=1 Tax=Romanomermis culicivorax TaxID=13658 RepID=A0A915IEB0_ROMCU